MDQKAETSSRPNRKEWAKRAYRAPICERCSYWENEARRAIAARKEVLATLEAVNGPSALWRKEARRSRDQEQRAVEREAEVRQELFRVQGDRDRVVDQIASAKERLWELWSGMSDDMPVKAQLWDVWSGLCV